jgi:hypothetical protein
MSGSDNDKLRELSQKVENFEANKFNYNNGNKVNNSLIFIPILVILVIFFTKPSFILKKKKNYSRIDNNDTNNYEINYLYLAIIFFMIYLVVVLYSNSCSVRS